MVAPQWVIIYDDDSTFSSDDGAWEEAPHFGVQAIVYQNIETGWSLETGGHYYHRLPDGEIIPMGFDSLMDYATNVWKKIKVGRQLSREEYNQAMKLAGEIMLLVTKTGYFKNERKA